ncbi:MAG TPA: DUF47 family protein [Candidatus Gastranaerophilales bacterium]|nr:DUF47 family protein [Candidatus Gastranaerophilales bacterium]
MSNFNILKLILPPEEKIFYELFEKSSCVCCESALILKSLLKGDFDPERLIKIKELRKISSSLAKETLEQLNKTFVTPIDREDIQYIASKLNRINKKITKTYQNLKIYNLKAYFSNIEKHVDLLVEASNEIRHILSELKKVSDMKRIIQSSQKVKEIENAGDELFVQHLEDLFSGKYDALTVIKLKDIYNSIENALNTCSDISDEVVRIVLKHS